MQIIDKYKHKYAEGAIPLQQKTNVERIQKEILNGFQIKVKK